MLHIRMFDDNTNLGMPKEKCVVTWTTCAAATGEKSTKSRLASITVPIIKPIKSEIDLINPYVKIVTKRRIRTVIAARKRL